MADEPSWDELFSSQPGAKGSPEARPAGGRDGSSPRTEQLVERRSDADPSRRDLRASSSKPSKSLGRTTRDPVTHDPAPRRKRRLTWLWALLSVGLVLGIGAGAVYLAFGEQIRGLLETPESTDYEGTGTTEVVVTITAGQVGGDVAQTLVDSGVVKTYQAFYGLLLESPTVSFQPGSYALKTEMSAESALAALMDPANRRESTVLVQEGKSITQALELVSAGTEIPVADLTAAAADVASYGVPAEAPSLEGYLFPATYKFEPGADARTVIQTMVNRTFEATDAAGVPPADRHRVLTLAALIQREAGPIEEDFYKVSRVFTNRLEQGQNLQSDATVSYGTGRTDTVNTNEAERADASNRYNTYANPGLPVGPIGAVGDLGIDAALHPADGPWLYFVPVNLETGETVFSTTFDEHQKAVSQLSSWCKSTGSELCN